ncbi:MAG: hypothetical protein HYZ47_05485 [Simkania negevensis]|nr:hypothetical protein [Simkania negevensis]
MNFIGQISRGSVPSQIEAAEILSADCKKVLNGQLFTQSREDFVMDLLSVYKNQGAWEVFPADIIVSSHAVVLRLFIEMEKAGAYTAMVILRYDADCLITEINEVLSPVKGGYDF